MAREPRRQHADERRDAGIGQAVDERERCRLCVRQMELMPERDQQRRDHQRVGAYGQIAEQQPEEFQVHDRRAS
jgi:hypothetical protein